MINIVLIEPEIPQNTGNIARTCAALGATLHLVEPLGFNIDEKSVKRAGLDYWSMVSIYTYPSSNDFFERHDPKKMYYCSTKAQKNYCDIDYSAIDGDIWLVFGKETKGLDENLLHDNYERCIRIPMINGARSLNLSNAVAIIAYDVARQLDFFGLEKNGHLTKF